ncbi:MAG: hypothetical protein Kow0010_07340 [Dehalococcoidia bacterium]
MVKDPRTSAGAHRLRPLNEPQPVAVDAAPGGSPRAVLWRGRYRRVAAIADTWRIDDEWWRTEIARRYYAVDLEGGGRLTLYHDLLEDAWYAQPYRARVLSA